VNVKRRRDKKNASLQPAGLRVAIAPGVYANSFQLQHVPSESSGVCQKKKQGIIIIDSGLIAKKAKTEERERKQTKFYQASTFYWFSGSTWFFNPESLFHHPKITKIIVTKVYRTYQSYDFIAPAANIYRCMIICFY
jgi:predicted alpha/beta superfamily hydrolase